MTSDSLKALVQRIYDLLESDNITALKELLEHEDPHVIASVLDRLDTPAVADVFLMATHEKQSELIVYAQSHTKDSIVDELTDLQLFAFLEYNDDDDATDILQFIDDENRRERILKQFSKPDREKIQTLLRFDADTAGGLMDAHYIITKPSYTVHDIAEKVQQHYERNGKIPLVLVASYRGALLGYIPHRSLILYGANDPVADIVESVQSVNVDIDQEELLQTLQQSNQDFLVVTNGEQKPIGVVHVKDLLKIAQQEATEDVYKFAGVQEAESPFETIPSKVQRRYKWLVLNLGTAFLASVVVSFFQDEIAQLALLAVFMPIVAGEGGNAATQSLAVVVRGLATQNISWTDARLIILRECIAGVYNGAIVGAVAAGAALLFGANPLLGLVLGIAMICNLFIAGLFGSLVPFILKALRIDPATASSIFVTTATDIFGFLVFLGLGSAMLL